MSLLNLLTEKQLSLFKDKRMDRKERILQKWKTEIDFEDHDESFESILDYFEDVKHEIIADVITENELGEYFYEQWIRKMPEATEFLYDYFDDKLHAEVDFILDEVQTSPKLTEDTFERVLEEFTNVLWVSEDEVIIDFDPEVDYTTRDTWEAIGDDIRNQIDLDEWGIENIDEIYDYIESHIWTNVDLVKEYKLVEFGEKYFWDSDFYTVLKEMKDNSKLIDGQDMIYIEREMAFKNEEDFWGSIREDVGVYWSWMEGHAEAYGGKGRFKVLLRGYAPLTSVDWTGTIYVTYWGLSEELEVRLMEQYPLYLESIEFLSEDDSFNKKDRLFEIIRMYFPKKSNHDIRLAIPKVIEYYKENDRMMWVPKNNAKMTFDNYLKVTA